VRAVLRAGTCAGVRAVLRVGTCAGVCVVPCGALPSGAWSGAGVRAVLRAWVVLLNGGRLYARAALWN
ncbi:hypothetical protein, partial [Streptomyces carpinensis]|uniref:hypothetical protein n=1 Tax=Streptomyces carpinensis TaxID=66369 RepID=UPI00130234E7